MIKILRFYQDGEYLLGELEDYLKKEYIIYQLTTPGTPPQISIIERNNRTLMDMARSMMSYLSLPDSFWGYILETAV